LYFAAVQAARWRPVIVTAEQLPAMNHLMLTCMIQRGTETILSRETSTSRLNRTVETLIDFLLRSNPVPAGSVMLTGIGIIVLRNLAQISPAADISRPPEALGR
jgi:hypothetical protein